MKTFAVFALALVHAQSASKPAPTANIKDNMNHILEIGQVPCDGEVKGNITIASPKAGLPYLYPILQDKMDVDCFNRTGGSRGKEVSYVNGADGNSLTFPGHFAISDLKIKQVSYSSSAKETKYSVYVIPPEVSAGEANGKPHEKSFSIITEFTCNGAKINEAFTEYPFVVTNNVRTVSLVSSALVLALSSILLL